MNTYDALTAQLATMEAGQASGRAKALEAIAKAQAYLAKLDAKLDPTKDAMADLVATRSKLLTPWSSESDERRAHRYLFNPTRPLNKTWDSRAWARAMGTYTDQRNLLGLTWTWTADISHDSKHNMKQIQTTPREDESGWNALLVLSDAELVARGYILLNTPEEVEAATRTYWPTMAKESSP